MQGRRDEKGRKRSRPEGRKGGEDEDFFRRGWLAGYEREKRLILEKKEEEDWRRNET